MRLTVRQGLGGVRERMGKKILLADDSITIQKVIELTFSDEDFDVVTVGNGRLALEKLPEVRPDIVLCDIIMPEKDGYEVCEQIKASSAFSHVPVLLLTGAFEPFDQERAAQVGSDGFLAKPFEPETLIAKVKDLLGRAGSPMETAAPAPAAVSPADSAPLSPADSAPVSPADSAPISPADSAPISPADSAPFAPAAPTAQPMAPAPPPTEPMAPSPLSEAETPTAKTRAVSPSFIPDEPFAPIESGALEESPAAAPAETPLAAVTPEESATLAGEPGTGKSKDDTASTVMFKAGDLPWTGGAPGGESPSAPEPPTPEPPPAFEAPLEAPVGSQTTEPEPVFTPEPGQGADLADAAGAAFEEVLEEDVAFGGSGPVEALNSPAEVPGVAPMEEPVPGEGRSGLADSPATRTQAPTVPGGTDESPTLKVAVPALADDSAPVAPSLSDGFEPVPPPEPEPPAPAEPAPFLEPEPVETFEPVPPAPVDPQPAATFEPAPGETFEPAAPAAPESAPTFEPEPVETFEPGPAPGPEAFPEPTAQPAPEPVETFEPVPPAPAESESPFAPTPPPVETFEPVPPAPAEPQSPFAPAPPPAETFEPVPPAAPEATFGTTPSPTEPVVFAEAPEEDKVVETQPPTRPGAAPEDLAPPPGQALEPALEPEPEPPLAPAGAESVTTLPGVKRNDVVESFAEMGPGDEPDPAGSAQETSEAAQVPVPVDMVEKIAQRVVAQVSEKAVREIAWEVIPDLAEALIKQEIERLKAELQKL